MLESIKIKNFRCFEEIEVSGFKRVNFIVGQNATGKTALLEAMIVGLQGNLQTLTNLTSARENAYFIKNPNRYTYNSFWSHFFKDEIIENPFEISLSDSKKENKLLLNGFFENESISNNNGKTIEGYNPFCLLKILNEQDPIFERAKINIDGSMSLGNDKPVVENTQFIQANLPFGSFGMANVFSDFSRENKEHIIIDNMKKLFPKIESLSVEVTSITSVFAKYNDIKIKIPLSQVSFGINKALGIILSIMKNKNGIVLIDEIENGLHVSILEKFWQVLYDIAVENNVQLFITSHSKECMVAAEKVVTEHEADFSLFRMVSKDGKIIVRQTDGQSLSQYLGADYDFRG